MWRSRPRAFATHHVWEVPAKARGDPDREGMSQIMLETSDVLTRHVAIQAVTFNVLTRHVATQTDWATWFLLETFERSHRYRRKLDGRSCLVPQKEIGGHLHWPSKCLQRISRHRSLGRTIQSCACTPHLSTRTSQ